jgi:hypothetical protein
MAKYVIGEARFEGETLVEVAIQCIDEPDGPFLFDCEVATVSEVVQRLKLGDTVFAYLRRPGYSTANIPVEIVTLPNGEDSIEVVQRGQPENFKMANLPRLDATSDSTSPLD